MADARPLIDHDEIREWAEARRAKPACVRGTGHKKETGVIAVRRARRAAGGTQRQRREAAAEGRRQRVRETLRGSGGHPRGPHEGARMRPRLIAAPVTRQADAGQDSRVVRADRAVPKNPPAGRAVRRRAAGDKIDRSDRRKVSGCDLPERGLTLHLRRVERNAASRRIRVRCRNSRQQGPRVGMPRR
jgi:hypothetical protein